MNSSTVLTNNYIVLEALQPQKLYLVLTMNQRHTYWVADDAAGALLRVRVVVIGSDDEVR